MIFANLALDGDGYFDATGRQTLLSSAQVNKLWFQEAIRHLWTNPCGRLARPIPRLLGGVAPERRAVYASRICGGSLYAYKRKFGDRESMFMDEILDTIEFPKLRKITLYVQRCEDIVPRIKNHHVDRLLIIDLKHRTRYGYREPASPVDTTLDAIIEQIPVCGCLQEIIAKPVHRSIRLTLFAKGYFSRLRIRGVRLLHTNLTKSIDALLPETTSLEETELLSSLFRRPISSEEVSIE